MIRLPNGSRVERKFASDSKFEVAYWLMDTSEVCARARDPPPTHRPPSSNPRTQELREQFPDTDACSLVTTYPKKTFSLAEHGPKSFSELGLTGGVAMFVQKADA